MNKILFITIIFNAVLGMRQSQKNKNNSSSEVSQKPNVLKLIFSNLDNDNKQIKYLDQQVAVTSELKNFCSYTLQTKCSSSLINFITNQMAQAYDTMKMIREQIKQVDAAVHDLNGTIRVLRYIKEEFQYYNEFQDYYKGLNQQGYDPQQELSNALNYAIQLSKVQGQGLKLFNEVRKSLVQYYGGIFCGLCNNAMKDYSYWYKDEQYDYLIIQFNNKTKIELLNVLQKFNNFQNYIFKVAQIAKVALSYSGELRAYDAVPLMDIYQNAGRSYQAVHEGLELCKTSQTIENFLGQGDVQCYDILSYTGPFNYIDYFVPFDSAYQYIMRGLNYITMKKEKQIETKYKDPKGKMVDYSQKDKTLQFLPRPTESKQLYMDFKETGIDVTKQIFNYEALRTLSKKNRPSTYGFFNFMIQLNFVHLNRKVQYTLYKIKIIQQQLVFIGFLQKIKKLKFNLWHKKVFCKKLLNLAKPEYPWQPYNQLLFCLISYVLIIQGNIKIQFLWERMDLLQHLLTFVFYLQYQDQLRIWESTMPNISELKNMKK